MLFAVRAHPSGFVAGALGGRPVLPVLLLTATLVVSGLAPASALGSRAADTSVSPSPAATAVSPAAAVPAACTAAPTGQPGPAQAPYFNYPYGTTKAKRHIRDMVIGSINAVPACESISISVFSLNDATVVNALIAAYQRGVRVRVIVNSHMVRGKTASKQFRRLATVLQSNTAAPSWAIACRGSCRGTSGNHHSKMYLFSRVGDARAVTMMGTHNSTTKAVYGQWNSLDVYDEQSTYDYYSRVFDQESLDQPVAAPFLDQVTGEVETMFFPRPGTSAANDPFMRQMSTVQCKGTARGYGRKGRTMVRVAMYAWHDDRGLWLAKRVRGLWNAGCDVAVEYAIMGNNVKRVLYSPAGRGRIPMRQVTTQTRKGTIVNYLHLKYLSVFGKVSGNPRAQFTMTGTSNWAGLGLSSDDSVQVWNSYGRSAQYRANFYRIWRGPKARVPSPTSRLPAAVGTKNVKLGKGKYRNLEEN